MVADPPIVGEFLMTCSSGRDRARRGRRRGSGRDDGVTQELAIGGQSTRPEDVNHAAVDVVPIAAASSRESASANNRTPALALKCVTSGFVHDQVNDPRGGHIGDRHQL